MAAAHRGIMLIFSHQLSAIFSHCVELIEMHGREEENRDETDCFAAFFFFLNANKCHVTFLSGRERGLFLTLATGNLNSSYYTS